MPSQLYDNSAVSFVCARNFTYNGVDYEMGGEFDQEEGNGRLESLVRSRFIIPVVDNLSDKPRHWHREVKQRDEVLDKMARGSHMLNREKQMGLKTKSKSTTVPEPDAGQALLAEAQERIDAERAVREENQTEEEKEQVEMTPVEPGSDPEEGNEVDDLEAQEVERRLQDNDQDKDVFEVEKYTIPQILGYADEHPEELERLIEAEEAGQNRSTLVTKLYERLERRDG